MGELEYLVQPLFCLQINPTRDFCHKLILVEHYQRNKSCGLDFPCQTDSVPNLKDDKDKLLVQWAKW